MKKKIKKLLYALLVLIMCTNTIVYAAPESAPYPIANTYTEGIYHFENSIGNKIILELTTKDKPVSFAIFYEGDLKYFVNLNPKFPKTEVTLAQPLNQHTAIIVGEGELAFSFE